MTEPTQQPLTIESLRNQLDCSVAMYMESVAERERLAARAEAAERELRKVLDWMSDPCRCCSIRGCSDDCACSGGKKHLEIMFPEAFALLAPADVNGATNG